MTIYFSLNEYFDIQDIPKAGRVLGLDVGEKFIGIALSDERAVIASPFKYYERKSFQKDSACFQGLFSDYKIAFTVVGLPFNLDGTLSKQADRIIAYIDKLHSMHETDFVYWDERFSTMAVERAMLEQDMSRKKRETNIDKLAATYILQGALDYVRNRR